MMLCHIIYNIIILINKYTFIYVHNSIRILIYIKKGIKFYNSKWYNGIKRNKNAKLFIF